MNKKHTAPTSNQVTPALVQHIAQLAHIPLTSEKQERFGKQINAIVGHFAELGALDLDDVAQTSRTIDEENVWREDVVRESFSQSDCLRNARKTHNGFFVVPYLLTGKD